MQQNEALLEEDPWADLVNLDGLHIPTDTLLDQKTSPLHDQPRFTDDYDSFGAFGGTPCSSPTEAPAAAASDVGTREFSGDDASGEDSAASAVRPISLRLGVRLRTNMLASGSCRLCPLPQQ